MASEWERFVLEAKMAKLQMQHDDMIERRNAFLLAMVFAPFAILAIPSQLNLIGSNGILLVVALAAAGVYTMLDGRVDECNSKLKATQRAVDRLIHQVEMKNQKTRPRGIRK